MKDLYSKLKYLKLISNSYYGNNKIDNEIYKEYHKTRRRINFLNIRKRKINRIFNEAQNSKNT